MSRLTEKDLANLRAEHDRVSLELASGDAHAALHAAHADRGRLLEAVDQLLAVVDAARIVTGLVQRGPQPLAARRALLELNLALADLEGADMDLAKAGLDADVASRGLLEDEAAFVEPVRLSA